MMYAGACLIKSPLDFLIGLCREYALPLPPASDAPSSYNIWSMLLAQSVALQQEILGIPVVAGWYAYYESPAYHELWINSVTYPQRDYYTDLLISSGDMMNGTSLVIDPVGFAKSLSNPSDPVQLVTDSFNLLISPPVPAASQTLIMQTILLSGLTNPAYWTNAWTAYINDPTDMNAYSTVYNRLQALYKYLMDLPEYHLS